MTGHSLPISDTDIAVVGMSIHVPKAATTGTFWQNLLDGVEAISFFEDADLLDRGVAPSLLENPNFVRAGGVLENAENFDAGFFGFSAREAQIMDPQHRVFLECAWEALEDAGYDAASYGGPIGVYAGSTMNTYLLINLMTNRNMLDVMGDLQTMIGNDKEYLATRVSYKLNLTGPSYAVQTACSTSLVAVHVACQALLNGECDMAIAGGSSVRLPHGQGYLYTPGGTSSPNGHCRAFDAQAAGSVVGSGAGVIVLKPLADAVAAGDTVHAVIKGSAINNDGAAKASFTAPSVDGQATVAATALELAGVTADKIGYVEAHGTGTLLGDPIEVAALTRAYRKTTARTGYCRIGSVKTNIGHLDAAAGIAGIIKAILVVKHGKIPPSLGFESANPKIDFEHSPFVVNSELTPWPANAEPRLAAVNSVGIGGTNAHVIVAEPPVPTNPAAGSRPRDLVILSAKTPQALQAMPERLARHLQEHPDVSLADAAHTLRVGRAAFAHRAFCVTTADGAVTTLRRGHLQSAMPEHTAPPLAFLFSGQGSQYPNMLRGIYEREPTFRTAIDECSLRLARHIELDLRDVLYRGESEQAAQLAQTHLAQPALFVTEFAMVRLLDEWGITPSVAAGHSIGEYVAACLAGVFSLEDALRLVAERGRIVQALPSGAMLSVPLSETELVALLPDGVHLAAVNGPALCSVGGALDAITAFEHELAVRQVQARRLVVSHAFHTPLLDPAVPQLLQLMETIDLQPPRIPFVSNITGGWITDEQATSPGYWAEHLRHPVRFSDCAERLAEERSRVLLEVGPGTVLASLARLNASLRGRVVIALSRHPKDRSSDEEVLLDAVGKLWLAGAAPSWEGFAAHDRRRRVPLPTYPFQRQRLWIDPRRQDAGQAVPMVADATPAQPAAEPSQRSRQHNQHLQEISHQLTTPVWRRTPPLVPATDGSGPDRVLVFSDGSRLASRIISRLCTLGRDVMVVRTGDEFETIGDRTYIIRPAERRDYERLLRELRDRNKSFDTILYLWGLRPGDAGDQVSREALTRGPVGVASLACAVGNERVTCDLRLLLVTNGVYDVTGTEDVLPTNALVLGPTLAVGYEYANVSARIVDIELATGEEGVAQLASQITAEIDSQAPERVVALRREHRWTRDFDELRPAGAPRGLRENGVYLITGGLGDVGFTLGSYLAEAVGATLVLIDTAVPEDKAAAPSGVAGARLQALRKLAPEILAVHGDVGDEARMRQVVAEVKERFGAVDGVIHAAGVAEIEAICAVHETGASELERHFAAKVEGVRVLSRVLVEQPPLFCMVMSSLSSLIGGMGTSAYTSACAFMDAWVHARRRHGEAYWVTVNWDTWASLARTDAAVVGHERARRALSADGAVEMFRRILAAPPVAQVAVSAVALGAPHHKAHPVIPTAAAGGLPARETGGLGAAASRSENLPTAYSAPRDDLERELASIWQEFLGIDKVGIHDNFFELGGHSLLATQLITKMRQMFTMELPLVSLFAAPTVETLAAAIRAERDSGGGMSPPTAAATADAAVEDLLRELQALPDDEREAQLRAIEQETGQP